MGYFGVYLYALIPLACFLIILLIIDQQRDFTAIGIGIGVAYALIAWGITFWSKASVIDAQRFALFGSIIGIAAVIVLYNSAKGEGTTAFIVLCIAIGVTAIPGISIGIGSETNPALYMEENTVIYRSTQSAPIFPFNATPDPNSFRFITDDFAISIANQRASDFGSNTKISDANIIRVNGTLYWCIMYQHTQTVLENRLMGIILVDTNNPNVEPIIIKTDEWHYANNLWYNRDIRVLRYKYEQTNTWLYEEHYPAYDDEHSEWVYVSAAVKQDFEGNLLPNGLYITDVETGSTLNYYSMEDIANGDIPEYCIQVMSEDYIEFMVKRWGNYRDTSEPDNIDIWAESWIHGVSQDRFKIAEDTRYIVNPDNNSEIISVIPLTPSNKESTLYGYFITDQRGNMKLYDMNALGLIAPNVAGSTVRSLLTQPNEGKYEAGMPVMYYVPTQTGTIPAYYVPVYWTDNQTYRMSHFAIVSARDTSFNVIIDSSGKVPSTVVTSAQIEFANLYTNSTIDDENTFDGTITAIGNYISDGETIFVFATNNTDVLRLSQTYLSDETWNDVVLSKVGDEFRYAYFESNDILWCTAFTKLE